MYRKQLLKTGYSKKRRIGSCLLLSIILTGTIAGSVTAGNIEDWFYTYYSPHGYSYATVTRDKYDYTSAYILHHNDTAVNVEVRCNGTNYSANGGSYYAAMWVPTYLPNYVKESGLDNCYLLLTPSPSVPCSMEGQWSPDSV